MAFEGVGSVGNIATAKVRAAEGLSTAGAPSEGQEGLFSRSCILL